MERQRQEEEQRLQREELERFEKRNDKKRRRNRNRYSETVEPSFLSKHKFAIAGVLLLAVIVGAAVFTLQQ